MFYQPRSQQPPTPEPFLKNEVVDGHGYHAGTCCFSQKGEEIGCCGRDRRYTMRCQLEMQDHEDDKDPYKDLSESGRINVIIHDEISLIIASNCSRDPGVLGNPGKPVVRSLT